MTDPGAETAAQSFDILGETVTLPVRVRDATIHTAMFAVPAQGAQDLVDPSGLTVAPVAPGRTLCALMFIDYLDGDLKTYREYGVGFAVRGAGGPGASRVGALVHRLPVTEEFTLEAGRKIWGFPKVMSDIALSKESGAARGVLRIGGDLVADLRIARGLPVPGGGPTAAVDVYTHFKGRTRRIPWSLRPGATRSGPGGAHLLLGPHPWGEELRGLGLPRPALASTSMTGVQMEFGAAAEVATAP